jgi:mannosylglycoprotein endo-beta-mannosidase
VVCVVNQTAEKLSSINASIRLYDMHGKLLSEEKNPVNIDAHGMILLNKVVLPGETDEVYFLRLQLTNRDTVIDENLYWLSNKPHSYEKLNELEKVIVKTSIKKSDDDHAVIVISNPNSETAFFMRLKIMNAKDELVLPSFLTDNYFTLLPGDEKQIGLDLSESSSKASQDGLRLVIEGWNVVPAEVKF